MPEAPKLKHLNQGRYTQERDSAPSGPIPTHFQKVLPKNEPLSHYGNPASYYVNGEKYNILTSSKGYEAQGTASWYGTKFHKERTASGEPYDIYALTAAHKTLPLPTYVRVKNLENKREVIVKVNDRGPFYEDRLIDLSYAAATKLGLLPNGTARVKIEAISAAPDAHYYLQVGAFDTKTKAAALCQQLAQLHLESNIEIEHRNAHYLVQIGPFDNQAASESFKKRLSQHGITQGFSYLR